MKYKTAFSNFNIYLYFWPFDLLFDPGSDWEVPWVFLSMLKYPTNNSSHWMYKTWTNEIVQLLATSLGTVVVPNTTVIYLF